MSGNDVTVTMGAEDAQLVAAGKRAAQWPKDMAKNFQEAGEKGKKAGQEIESGMKAGQQSALGLVSAITGIGSGLAAGMTAARLFRAELDAIIQRQREAAGFQVGLATAQRRAFDALPAGGDLSAAALAQLVGTRSKVPMGEAYGTVGAALRESNGGLAASTSAEIGLAVGELFPHLDPAQAGNVAGFAVNLAKGDKTLTPAQAVAKARQISRASESEFGTAAQGLGDYVSRAGAYGMSTGDSAALALAFQDAMGGDTGGAAGAAEKLMAMLSREGGSLSGLSGNKKLSAKAIALFKRSPAAESAVKQLISGGGVADKFAELRGAFGGSGADALATALAEGSEAASIGTQQTAGRTRAIQAIAEQGLLSPNLAPKAVANQALAEASKIAGVGDMGGWMGGLRSAENAIFGAFETPEQYTKATRSQIASMRSTVSDPQALDLLNQLVEKMDEQLAELRSQNAMLQRGTPVTIQRNDTPQRTEKPAAKALSQ